MPNSIKSSEPNRPILSPATVTDLNQWRNTTGEARRKATQEAISNAGLGYGTRLYLQPCKDEDLDSQIYNCHYTAGQIAYALRHGLHPDKLAPALTQLATDLEKVSARAAKFLKKIKRKLKRA